MLERLLPGRRDHREVFASVEGGLLSESNAYIYCMHSDGERCGLEMELMSQVLDDGR